MGGDIMAGDVTGGHGVSAAVTGLPCGAPVSAAGSAGDRAPDGAIALLDIRSTPVSVDEVLRAVAAPAAGGIALFVGAVREHDAGRVVGMLGYTAHPSALTVLRQVAQRILQTHPVVRLAAVHRVGELTVGEIAVVVAVACQHRGVAFDACRTLIDTLKDEVPIWKQQVFTDGTQEWVGGP